MEPEVDNNMKKCITNALSPKRVSDPAYGKDWLIDWLIEKMGFKQQVHCLMELSSAVLETFQRLGHSKRQTWRTHKV